MKTADSESGLQPPETWVLVGTVLLIDIRPAGVGVLRGGVGGHIAD